jgi:hypothetical protein
MLQRLADPQLIIAGRHWLMVKGRALAGDNEGEPCSMRPGKAGREGRKNHEHGVDELHCERWFQTIILSDRFDQFFWIIVLGNDVNGSGLVWN